MSSSISLKRWQLLSPLEKTAVSGLAVTPQQIEFAGTVERAIESCKADQSDQVAGLAILRDRVVVGFLVLKRGTSAPSWADPAAATVSALRVDLSHQGQGIGSAALKVLPSWVAENWRESPSLALSVDEENHSARNAYARAGFVDHGTREQGRIGWVRFMSKPVRSSA
jgi:diamine N-acetyltransferase